MKKQKISTKLLGCSVAVAACIAWAGTAGAYMDMAAMMDEGITYESAAPQKSFTVTHEKRANLEAEMAEGIVYADSVVPSDQVLIMLDHRQLLRQGMEACLCEDPVTLVVESKISD